jgi:DNA-binding CsgD family transcriptional regulator/tetratricopeptide (TPR) repeat protein
MSAIGLTVPGENSSFPARDPGDVPLVGRDEQLTAVRTALGRVERGGTAAVFVEAEIGVGKSRLLAAAGEQARAAGAVVLAGTCLDIGDASPLHPLRQALRRLGTPTRPDPTRPEPSRPEPDPVTGSAGASAAGELDAARHLLAVLDHEAASRDGAGALLERLSSGLADIAGGRPLVLIVDDLQWADRTTRKLLLYLLAGLGGIPLLLLGAVRTESLLGDDPLRTMLAELRRLRTVRVLRLPPLDRAGTTALAAAVLGRPLDRAAAERLWQRSGGVPFVVEELARELRDGRDGLSETLRETFLARLDALAPDAHLVVQAVSTGIEPVPHDLLSRVVPLDEERLLNAARDAVSQRILTASGDGYRFRYRLVREVLQARLLPGEQIRAHRRYAEALAGGTGGELRPARLAHHWRLAGDPARALPAAIAAAREAERLGGYAEAFEHWNAALDLRRAVPDPDPDAPEVATLGRLAVEAAHRCGEHERALALAQRLADDLAGTPGRTDEPVPSWLRMLRARLLAAVGRLAEAQLEYESTLAASDVRAAERVAAAAHAADLLRQLGRYAEAGKWAQDALDLARGVADCTSSLVLAGATLGYSQAFLDDHAAGVATLRAAGETARRFGTPLDAAQADLHLAELLSGPLNELTEGVAVARRGAADAERAGLGRTGGARLLAVAANGLFRLGRWAEAEQAVEAALRHRPAGADAVELLLARCRVHVGYGHLDDSERDLESVETLLAAGGGVRQLMPLLTLRAGIAMWRDQPGEARAAVRQGLDLAESRSDDVWLQAALVWHGLRAEAEARFSRNGAPDQQTIDRLRAVADRMAEQSATAPVRGAVAGYRDLCAAELSRVAGRSDPAGWARTARVWDRLNHPYPAAYARLRQAEALFGIRTRNAEAAEVLRAAYRIGRRLGAGPLVEEIRALAARARVILDDPPATADRPAPATADRPGGGSAGDAAPAAGSTGRAAAGVTGRAAAAGATGRAAAAGTAGPAADAVSGAGGDLASLTGRERQVLALVARGHTNRAIAAELFISERTVGVHVSHIFDKLQVRTRVEATLVYERSGPPPAVSR